MVVPHQRGDLSQSRVLRDHVRADVRVPAHDLPLVVGQGPGLVEDVVPDSDLAQVVERARSAQQLALTIPKVEVLTEPTCHVGDADGM